MQDNHPFRPPPLIWFDWNRVNLFAQNLRSYDPPGIPVRSCVQIAATQTKEEKIFWRTWIGLISFPDWSLLLGECIFYFGAIHKRFMIFLKVFSKGVWFTVNILHKFRYFEILIYYFFEIILNPYLFGSLNSKKKMFLSYFKATNFIDLTAKKSFSVLGLFQML